MMAIAIKMASPASISSVNAVNLKDISFNTSKTRNLLPSDFLISKLCTLTNNGSRLAYMMPLHSLHGTSWNFYIKPVVDSAMLHKNALRAAVRIFYAKEDNNVRKVAKSNCPRMSMKERNPKRLSSSASGRIELDYFQVLKYPLVTELAMQEMLQKNTLVFVVDRHADKKNIKAAIEKISSVQNLQTQKVNTLVMPNGNKKAYITLRPNHSALDIAKKLGII